MGFGSNQCFEKYSTSSSPCLSPGKLEKFYPAYEAGDTFLYTSDETTKGGTHIRDAIDTKRMMTMVVVALLPCCFMALYNTGYQAQEIIHAQGDAFQAPETLWSGSWRYSLMDALGVDYRADRGSFLSLGSILPCCIHGLLFFLPVYIVTMAVGGTCEMIFSVIRGHEINEGFLVTGLLFPLTLPPTIPLWQVGLAIAFGVVIGKEIFGGTGRNFLNPALTARAFLYFAYPRQISGSVWTAVDGYSGATALGAIAGAEKGKITDIVGNLASPAGGQTWLDCFWGNMHGSMGETSVFCCLLGAAFLIFSRIGSWRIMTGTLIGLVGFSLLIMALPAEKPIYNLSPWWHLVLGGYAFGAVFMATDPVSASMTDAGKWAYGILIGVMTVVVRMLNPAFPEGIMLAILFGNVFAPLIDYFVVQADIKRRLARYA
ncbi:MAG: NADH:ubiquinone reductase (Na(+)-transporting) subunit B [Pirellulaceae bacterium]